MLTGCSSGCNNLGVVVKGKWMSTLMETHEGQTDTMYIKEESASCLSCAVFVSGVMQE